MIIKFKKSFIKQYKKLSIINQRKSDSAIMLLRQNPFDERLKNHPLKGKMEGLRSISAGFDLRLIFEVEGEYITVTMLEVGAHSQIYF